MKIQEKLKSDLSSAVAAFTHTHTLFTQLNNLLKGHFHTTLHKTTQKKHFTANSLINTDTHTIINTGVLRLKQRIIRTSEISKLQRRSPSMATGILGVFILSKC